MSMSFMNNVTENLLHALCNVDSTCNLKAPLYIECLEIDQTINGSLLWLIN